jgi:hypothetical protein
MSDLYENAMDSIDFGIRLFLQDDGFKSAQKHALLAVFHGVELLLKARLYKEHPLLIYKRPESRLDDDAFTISLPETLARFRNCGIEIDKAEAKTLEDLRRRRNRIAHHRYKKDSHDYQVLGKAPRFVYDFLPKHMGKTLEEVLDGELFSEARKAILSYEELRSEADVEVERRTTPRSKDDLGNMPATAFCPECDNETLVIGTELGTIASSADPHSRWSNAPRAASTGRLNTSMGSRSARAASRSGSTTTATSPWWRIAHPAPRAPSYPCPQSAAAHQLPTGMGLAKYPIP